MEKQLVFLFIIGSILFFTSNCGTKPPATGNNKETSDLSNIGEDILAKVNQHRRLKGLAPLRMNPVISSEAAKHSQQMASGKTSFGHAGFDSRIQRISGQLGAVKRSAENVASGSSTADEVVRGWLNSPGHRQNIEGDFNLTGIGLARNRKGVLYFTQLFIRL
jgi:uncharacterized protein YkwD